jgi:Na+-transporting methylmalonyl-CoA/oxaloacetate decarboxylase gamma subunit
MHGQIVALIILILAMPAMATAQTTSRPAASDKPGVVMVDAVEITATVDAVDQATRLLTVTASASRKGSQRVKDSAEF